MSEIEIRDVGEFIEVDVPVLVMVELCPTVTFRIPSEHIALDGAVDMEEAHYAWDRVAPPEPTDGLINHLPADEWRELVGRINAELVKRGLMEGDSE